MNLNLNVFKTETLFNATISLFRQLGITLIPKVREDRVLNAEWTKQYLKKSYKNDRPYTDIKKPFVGLITDPALDLFAAGREQRAIDAATDNKKNYSGIVIFAAELTNAPNRSQIAELTRAVNREFETNPVGLVLKYENKISIAITERSAYRQEWREGEKVGKVIILRDINAEKPHTGHLRILDDLKNHNAANYNELYEHWLETLNINILNKKFFTEISHWYFWAAQNVKFPNDVEKDEDIRNSTNLIRLITRIIFIWFIKEKDLVPEKLFDEKTLETILKDFNKKGNYYNAILQNLFFGTLNQKIKERKFAKDGEFYTNKNQYGIKNLYRYADMFKSENEKEICKLFGDIPFLNGGLFDCLDKEDEDDKMKVKYIDGFSRNPKKQAKIPDFLFFGDERVVDINAAYNTKSNIYKSKGLVKILNSYKFTIAENTSQEEDVALDPELLGRVFENLLARYNPETKETASDPLGTFYTPREIVNYMVNESLTAYLREKVGEDWENNKQTINAINEIKILDPACGSGAFPMGILHKMVEILQKLDPENEEWRKLQEEKATAEFKDAIKIENQQERDKRLMEISDIFENNSSDYGRKLFLIENCIFGVDIQPIAVQISKLRFFLSLVIEQTPTKDANDNYGIKPLPNLETKFVAADTLVGLKRPEALLFDAPIIDKQNEIKENVHRYFAANTRQEKKKLQEKEHLLYKELGNLFLKNGWKKEVVSKVVSFNRYDQNAKSDWFDAELMFGVKDGFDVVIGNPPYVQVLKGIFNKEQFPYSEGKDKGKQNLYKVFVEASYNLTREHGIATMIVQSSLMCDLSSQFTRELLLTKTDIIEIIEFPKKAKNKGGQVFESVLQGTCIYFFRRNATSNDREFNVSIDNDVTTINHLQFETLKQNEIIQFYPNGYFIPLVYSGSFDVIRKMQKCSISIKQIIKDISKGDLNLTIESRYFSNKHTSVKLLRGKHIHRFCVDYVTDEFILNNYKDKVVSLNQKQRYLVCQNITGTVDKYRLHFALTTPKEKFLFGDTVNKFCVVAEIQEELLLGILNSKLLDWYFRKTSTNNHVNGYEIEQLPIPNISLSKQQRPIMAVVDKILVAKSKNPQADTSTLERQIDELVYALYGLTDAEIAIIEKDRRQ